MYSSSVADWLGRIMRTVGAIAYLGHDLLISCLVGTSSTGTFVRSLGVEFFSTSYNSSTAERTYMQASCKRGHELNLRRCGPFCDHWNRVMRVATPSSRLRTLQVLV